MSTYAGDMKKKFGVPFDPGKVKGSGGFKYGDRVVMASDAESWQSGVKKSETGTVSTIGGHSVSPDPIGKMIVVDWDAHGVKSVWKGTIEKIKKVPLPTRRASAGCDRNCPGCGMTFSPDPALCPPEVFKDWTADEKEATIIL